MYKPSVFPVRQFVQPRSKVSKDHRILQVLYIYQGSDGIMLIKSGNQYLSLTTEKNPKLKECCILRKMKIGGTNWSWNNDNDKIDDEVHKCVGAKFADTLSYFISFRYKISLTKMSEKWADCLYNILQRRKGNWIWSMLRSYVLHFSLAQIIRSHRFKNRKECRLNLHSFQNHTKNAPCTSEIPRHKITDSKLLQGVYRPALFEWKESSDKGVILHFITFPNSHTINLLLIISSYE